MLSRFIIDFLSRSKHLLILWLQAPSAVILEPKKIKSVTVSIVFPSICHEVMGPDAMILVFWMLSFKPTFFSFSSLFILLFKIVFVLPYIDMNPPWVYMCSPFRTPLPPPSPSHPSGSSQCTSPQHPEYVYYHMWIRLPIQVPCMRHDAQSWYTGMTQRDGMGREVRVGLRMGNTCTPMAD